MGLIFEQPKSVNEGEDAEKPKDERAPVQRLVMLHIRATLMLPISQVFLLREPIMVCFRKLRKFDSVVVVDRESWIRVEGIDS